MTGTPTPPAATPTPNPDCGCTSTGVCRGNYSATACQFDKFEGVTYSSPIGCKLDNNMFQTAPTTQNKIEWCRYYLKTKGDADGDGTVTFKDYFYYVTAKLGFKIPPTVNPDFNGDNVVDTKDRDIIVKSLLGT